MVDVVTSSVAAYTASSLTNAMADGENFGGTEVSQIISDLRSLNSAVNGSTNVTSLRVVGEALLGCIEIVFPAGDSSLDADAIQDALDGDATEVVLAPGTFILQHSVVVPAGKTLRGLNATLQRQAQVATTTDTNLSAGVTTAFIVASASNLKVGDALGFQLSTNVSNGTATITNIAGTTITVSPAVEITETTNGINVFTTCSLVVLRDGASLIGLTLDGNVSNNAIGFWQTTGAVLLGDLVTADTGDRAKISRCRIINEAGEGIETDGADDFIVEDCYFDTLDGNAIHLGATNGCVIRGCTFTDTNQRTAVGHADGCISLSNDVTELVVDGCHFRSSPLAGIGGIDSADNNHIKIIGCDFEDIVSSPIEGTQPQNSGANNITVSKCSFVNCGALTISQSAASTSNLAERWSIDDCDFTETTVVLQNLYRSNFTNNRVAITATTGVAVGFYGCFESDVSDNFIQGAQHCIYFQDAAANARACKITGNRLYNPGTGGSGINVVDDTDGACLVADNVVSFTEASMTGSRYGIVVASTFSGNTLAIKNNTFNLAGSGGTLHGIYCQSTNSRINILGNTVIDTHTGAGNRGIRALSNDVIKGNTVTMPGTAGSICIEVVGASLTPIVQGNTAVNSATGGAIVVTTTGSTAIVVNNQVDVAVTDSSGGFATLRDNDVF